VTTPFNLTSLGTATLTFTVPVTFDVGKLRYAIYLASGRALYLNGLYLYPRPPTEFGFVLTTDRQVYAIGDTVTVTVNVSRPGDLVLAGPNLAVTATVDPGSHLYLFTLPPLRSGTYLIDATFEGHSLAYPIDVIGYSGRILGSALDQAHYVSGDTVYLTLTMEVNRPFDGLAKAWLFDPHDAVIGSAAANHTFTLGENVVPIALTLDTNRTGVHAVVYRIYAYGSYIFLTSGARYFDATYTDDEPPSIAHLPVTSGVAGAAIGIAALVTDNVHVAEVALYYRLVGVTSFTRLPMSQCLACIDTYNATIPATAVTADVEYYVNASDGANVALSGSPASPHQIRVNRYPAAVTLNTPSGITHDALTLSWTTSDAPDFANYTVYQSTTSETLGTAIATLTDASTTTHAVAGLTPETRYYFTVRVTDTGGLTADSTPVSATTTAAPQPSEIPWLYVIPAVVIIGIAVAILYMRRSVL
jgi:hypothetical protein